MTLPGGGAQNSRPMMARSALHAPTCHFGVLDHRQYTPAYLASLAPDVRAALERHIAGRARHPEVDQYHAWLQQFISREFEIR